MTRTLLHRRTTGWRSGLLRGLAAAGLSLAAVCATGLSSAQAEPPPGYELTFADEFDEWGVDFSNTWDTHWRKWQLRHMGGNNDRALKVADWERLKGQKRVGDLLHEGGLKWESNYLHLVKGGHLRLRTWPVPDSVRDQLHGFPFVAGMINGARAHNQTYGYWEARLNVGKVGSGHHFAFWLLPSNHTWPPEIDILEVNDDDGYLYHFSHQNGYVPPITYYRPPGGLDRWITVGFEWRPDAMIWTVDGREMRRERANIPARPMYPLMTLEVGSYWPGWPDSKTEWPNEVLVDYIRIYEKG
ncbi:MAG: glycoside hydrolase family 16 protein [Geminicoccaceae bacterium]|nr:glycoside hydrolase family 16 protein [Geminicoccaceae bacterium]